MDWLHYVHLDAWPDFRLFLRQRDLDVYYCQCILPHRFPAPIIVESRRRNLLIYVTHGGDGPHVEAAFSDDFMRLPPTVGRRPYTFVHGWRGLETMLDIFDGLNPDGRGPVRSPLGGTWNPLPMRAKRQERPKSEAASSLHPSERSTQETLFARQLSSLGCSSSVKLVGFIYGDLFFYDPKHRAIEGTVAGMLEFAATTTTAAAALKLAAIFEEFCSFIGPIHPWIVQELGHLHLRANSYADAEKWLTLAAALEHRWLAATRTFIDATPSRKAEVLDAVLQHERPASALGDVTLTRHVVNGGIPAVNDQDLWDFPEMAEAAIPPAYSYKHGLAAQGLVHGRLHRAALDECWLDLPGSGDLVTLAMNALILRRQISSLASSADYMRFFWEGYVLGRWDLAIGAFDSPATRRRGIGKARSGDVLARIERMLEEPQGLQWFEAWMHAEYLAFSAKVIRLRGDVRLL